MNFLMDPINHFFGAILNVIFEGVVRVSPVASLGITIVIFTLVARLLLTPLQLSSQRTSRGMSKLQPEMQRIQNKYKDKKDQESQLKYSAEMQQLYKKYKINPLSGCLPLLIQFPLIIALFNVLREPARYITKLGAQYTDIATKMMSNDTAYPQLLEGFKKAVFTNSRIEYDITKTDQLAKFLSHLNSSQWKEVLSKLNENAQPILRDALKTKEQFENFLGVNLVDTPALLIKDGMWLAILVPIIAGASTYIFSKITMASSTAMQPASADGKPNSTESMMKTMNIMMPIMTAMFSYTMPIGLAVYWIAGNVIMMGQQWFVNKIVAQQEAKLEEQLKKEREEAAKEKKVVKKKVLKKVPVQKLTTEEDENTDIQNENNK